MAYISKITVPINGVPTTFDLKDANAATGGGDAGDTVNVATKQQIVTMVASHN